MSILTTRLKNDADNGYSKSHASALESMIKQMEECDPVLFRRLLPRSDQRLLVDALKQLHDMVGMTRAKTNIVRQVQLLMLEQGKIGGHLLHTIIRGEPGCGKTSLAVCLAKIWSALGLVGSSAASAASAVSQETRPCNDIAADPSSSLIQQHASVQPQPRQRQPHSQPTASIQQPHQHQQQQASHDLLVDACTVDDTRKSLSPCKHLHRLADTSAEYVNPNLGNDIVVEDVQIVNKKTARQWTPVTLPCADHLPCLKGVVKQIEQVDQPCNDSNSVSTRKKHGSRLNKYFVRDDANQHHQPTSDNNDDTNHRLQTSFSLHDSSQHRVKTETRAVYVSDLSHKSDSKLYKTTAKSNPDSHCSTDSFSTSHDPKHTNKSTTHANHAAQSNITCLRQLIETVLSRCSHIQHMIQQKCRHEKIDKCKKPNRARRSKSTPRIHVSLLDASDSSNNRHLNPQVCFYDNLAMPSPSEIPSNQCQVEKLTCAKKLCFEQVSPRTECVNQDQQQEKDTDSWAPSQIEEDAVNVTAVHTIANHSCDQCNSTVQTHDDTTSKIQDIILCIQEECEQSLHQLNTLDQFYKQCATATVQQQQQSQQKLDTTCQFIHVDHVGRCCVIPTLSLFPESFSSLFTSSSTVTKDALRAAHQDMCSSSFTKKPLSSSSFHTSLSKKKHDTVLTQEKPRTVQLQSSSSLQLGTKDALSTSKTQQTTPVSNENKQLCHPWKIVSRVDFVAEYAGQTAAKTKRLIESMLGGVIIIDEAYSLFNGPNDAFGMEALDVINQWMTSHPHEIIFVLIGYADKLSQSIFQANAGLKRRFKYTVDVDSYSPRELALIFEKQLDRASDAMVSWKLTDETKQQLASFFENHISVFAHFGGDTEKLVRSCQEVYAEMHYEDLFKKNVQDQRDVSQCRVYWIDSTILNAALQELKQNQLFTEAPSCHSFMYT